MLWTTSSAPGHYCLQVQLQPADDTNTQNNLGQENTNVGAASSPAEFTFKLRNDTDKQQAYAFALDAYVHGSPDACGPTNSAAERLARMARHRRGAHPIPPGWQVTVNPASPVLDPGHELPIKVTATPPAGFTGRQALNVCASHSAGLAGGVTLTVKAA
jgi:hypothetical protein